MKKKKKKGMSKGVPNAWTPMRKAGPMPSKKAYKRARDKKLDN